MRVLTVDLADEVALVGLEAALGELVAKRRLAIAMEAGSPDEGPRLEQAGEVGLLDLVLRRRAHELEDPLHVRHA